MKVLRKSGASMVVWKLVRFSRIEGESGGSTEMKRFNMDMNVTSMKKEGNELLVDFTYRIDYSKEVGFIILNGQVQASGEKKELDEIVAGWKAKKLPVEFAAQLSNVILYNCEINGVLVSRVLAIPAPVIPPNITTAGST